MRVQIDGNPIPYARPRVTKFTTFDPRASEKKKVKSFLISKNFKPQEGCLRAKLIFNMYIPRSASKKRKKAMEEGILKPVKKPDLDNLVKFILDCANGILYTDDSQILEISAMKRYSSDPSTIIHLENLDES